MSSDPVGSMPTAVDISGTSVTIIGGVTISGNQVFISGQPVAISGQSIYLISGNNAVQISGQTIVVPSTSVSGNAIRVSGQTVISEISGQTIVVPSTSVSGNVVRTSGQVAYLVSGQNGAQLYAYDPSGDALRPLIVNQSGGNVLRVDAGAINVASNVSGNVVYLTSGQNAVQNSGQIVYPVSGKGFLYGFDPSGVTWNEVYVDVSGGHAIKIAGNLSANVSGNAVTVSGNMVSVSGQPVSVSGNMVSTSGQKIRLQAYDPSGDTYNDLIVNQSGGNVLRVDAGSIQVSANVSGNVVYLTSGNNDVQISGQVVNISGNSIIISDAAGNTATINTLAGDAESNSADSLFTSAYLFGYDQVQDAWARARVTASGQGMSGIHHKFAVTFSGDSIIGSVSGNMVTISGQVVTISGNIVNTSGQ